MSQKEKKWLLAIFLVTVFLRFWGLGNQDLISDDALYSFRALGWFDYLGGGQTTPVQWFGEIPWWANLSFHDGPPVVLAVQKVFFTFFGANTLAARLPFALAGVGVVFLLYFLLKKMGRPLAALWVGWLAAVSSYLVWASRTGYLEGVEIIFIVLCLFFFVFYLQDKKPRYLWFWGLSAGLAVASKYTALFLLPGAFFYFILFQRPIFKKKEFWLSGLIVLAVLSPVIFYNFEVWQTRGHFDAALSSMVGMRPADFSAIANRTDGVDYLYAFISLAKIFATNSSLTLVVLMVLAFACALWRLVRRQSAPAEKFLWLNFLFLLILFVFMGGGGVRFASIAMPFLLVFTALFMEQVGSWSKKRGGIFGAKFPVAVFIVILVLECLYGLNTNIKRQPAGAAGWFYARDRFYNAGFSQLERYLNQRVLLPPLGQRQLRSLDDINENFKDLAGKNLILFDDTINWFAYSWYLQRLFFFYNYPVISLSGLQQAVPAGENPFVFLDQNEASGFYYIFAVGDLTLDSVKKGTALRELSSSLAADLENSGIKPAEIKDSSGNLAFKVYYVKF